jgi:hypothetical protein
MAKCECGNDRFLAHQKCFHDVIVDGNNNWQENNDQCGGSVYESENPYGPYKCCSCGKITNELPKE